MRLAGQQGERAEEKELDTRVFSGCDSQMKREKRNRKTDTLGHN